jgi:hypothetical protein
MGTSHRPQDLVSPPAVRLRRPGWRDPRLLAGLILVAGSVALGSGLVAAAADSVPVYVSLGPLVPGDVLDTTELAVREVRLAESLDRYLRADRDLPVAPVVVRAIGAGELVPVSAIASSPDTGLRPVAISSSEPLPSGVVKGSTVDLWFVPELDPGQSVATAPFQLAAGLTVSEVSSVGGGFSVGSGVTVHVLVPARDLADVLAARTGAGSVEVVHIPGGAG